MSSVSFGKQKKIIAECGILYLKMEVFCYSSLLHDINVWWVLKPTTVIEWFDLIIVKCVWTSSLRLSSVSSIHCMKYAREALIRECRASGNEIIYLLNKFTTIIVVIIIIGPDAAVIALHTVIFIALLFSFRLNISSHCMIIIKWNISLNLDLLKSLRFDLQTIVNRTRKGRSSIEEVPNFFTHTPHIFLTSIPLWLFQLVEFHARVRPGRIEFKESQESSSYYEWNHPSLYRIYQKFQTF